MRGDSNQAPHRLTLAISNKVKRQEQQKTNPGSPHRSCLSLSQRHRAHPSPACSLPLNPLCTDSPAGVARNEGGVYDGFRATTFRFVGLLSSVVPGRQNSRALVRGIFVCGEQHMTTKKHVVIDWADTAPAGLRLADRRHTARQRMVRCPPRRFGLLCLVRAVASSGMPLAGFFRSMVSAHP